MVSIASANSVVSLIGSYNTVTAAIAAAQQAVAAGGQALDFGSHMMIGGTEVTLAAATPCSVADSATILNAIIAVWQGQQAALAAQIDALK